MELKVRIVLGIILVLTTSWSLQGASLQPRLLRRALKDEDTDSNHPVFVTNTTFLNQNENVTNTQEKPNSSHLSDDKMNLLQGLKTIASLENSSDGKPNVTSKPKFFDDDKKLVDHTTYLPSENKPNETITSSSISTNTSTNRSSNTSQKTSLNRSSNAPNTTLNTSSNKVEKTQNDSHKSESKTTPELIRIPLRKQNTSFSILSKPLLGDIQIKRTENKDDLLDTHSKTTPKLSRISLEKQNTSFSIFTKPLIGNIHEKPTSEAPESTTTQPDNTEKPEKNKHPETNTSRQEEFPLSSSKSTTNPQKNSQEDKINTSDEELTSIKPKPFEKNTMSSKQTSFKTDNLRESSTETIKVFPNSNNPLYSDPTGSTFAFTVVTEKPKPFEKKPIEDNSKEPVKGTSTTSKIFVSTEKSPLMENTKDNLKQEAQVTGKIVYKKVQDLEATTTKDRKDNGRSLKVDIEKYISPEFHSKNNVYTLPTSPEIEKYLDPNFDNLNTDDGKSTSKGYFSSTPDMNDYNVVLTTPHTDIFDSKFRQVTDKIKQNLDDQEVNIRYSGEEDQEDRVAVNNPSDKYELTKLIEKVQQADNDTDVFLQAKEFKNLGINTGEMNNNRDMEKGMSVNYASSFIKSSVYPERYDGVQPSNNISNGSDVDKTEDTSSNESVSASFISKTFVPAKFAIENLEIVNNTDDDKLTETTSKPTKKPRHQFGLHNNTIETSVPENEIKVKKIFTTTSEPLRLHPVHQTEKSTYVKPLMESPINISKRGSTKITSPKEGITPNGIQTDLDNTNFSIPTTATAWTLITLKEIPNRSTEQSEASSGYDEDDGWIRITTSPRQNDVTPTKTVMFTTEAHQKEITTSTPTGFQTVSNTSRVFSMEDSSLSESTAFDRNESTTIREAKTGEPFVGSSSNVLPDSQTEEISTEVVDKETNINFVHNETTNALNKEASTKELVKETTPQKHFEVTTPEKEFKETTPQKYFKETTPAKDLEETTISQKHFKEISSEKHFEKTTPQTNFEGTTTPTNSEGTTPPTNFERTTLPTNFEGATAKKYFEETTSEEHYKKTTLEKQFKETTPGKNLKEKTPDKHSYGTTIQDVFKETTAKQLLNETSMEDIFAETTTEVLMKETIPGLSVTGTIPDSEMNFTTISPITPSFQESTFLPNIETKIEEQNITNLPNPTTEILQTSPLPTTLSPTTTEYFETTTTPEDITTYQTIPITKLSSYSSSVTTEIPTTFETSTDENLLKIIQNIGTTIPAPLNPSTVVTKTPETRIFVSTRPKSVLQSTTSEPQEDDLDNTFNHDDNDYSEMPVNKKGNKTDLETNVAKEKPKFVQNKTADDDINKVTTTGIPNLTAPENENATRDSTSSTELLSDGDDTGETNSGIIAAIVISIVGGLCLVTLVGLFLLMKKRQKKITYRQRCRPVSLDAYSLDNVSVYNSVRGKIGLRTSKRSYGNPAFDDPVSISHQMNFQSLAKFADNMEAIEAEFEEIPQVTARATEVPPGCETKNRYANVIPLPETRVFLKTFDNDPHSDYINANYVTGPKNIRRYYIACQAPLQSTVDDFWRMVWEQQTRVILMLTNLYENGVEKCVDYLPPSEVVDCHRLFGDYQITLKKREVKEKYIISSLQLKNMVSNSWREVIHLWYLGWPEKGVPSEANSLIAFLIEARSHLKASVNNNSIDNKANEGSSSTGVSVSEGCGPVVVHCSPGTGRTGTVLACDIAIRDFELTRNVDIPKIVYRIRRDRASAVQTKEQYGFIYKVITLYATKLTGGALEAI